jgi:hypothetical protein
METIEDPDRAALEQQTVTLLDVATVCEAAMAELDRGKVIVPSAVILRIRSGLERMARGGR